MSEARMMADSEVNVRTASPGDLPSVLRAHGHRDPSGSTPEVATAPPNNRGTLNDLQGPSTSISTSPDFRNTWSQ